MNFPVNANGPSAANAEAVNRSQLPLGRTSSNGHLAPWSPAVVAVLAVEPVPDTMRMLRPAARLALVEHYQGEAFVLTTDDQCPNGIEAAARSWAEATGAAYMSREAS